MIDHVSPLRLEAANRPDSVLECLCFLARRYDRPSSPFLLKAGLAVDEKGRLPFHQLERALEHAAMRGDPVSRPLARLRPRQLPAILRMRGGEAVVLLDRHEDDVLVFRPATDEPIWMPLDDLIADYDGSAILVEPDPTGEREGERPWQKAARAHWFWSEMRKVRHGFVHVVLAAALINLLSLALPLFTMNVYDRILPNKAAASLWVLSTGLFLALLLDFSVRLARAKVVDEQGRALDARLSQKLFEKILNLPLNGREGSTGALARRVSEYEIVREFFASTSVVLIVDLAFLAIFLLVIMLLGSWLVLVPIAGIGLMLLAGMVLQRAMARVAIEAQADSSLQHSVLVEAIAAQETLKAIRGEEKMLGRWRRYAEASAATQERLRGLTAVSFTLATTCQQMISLGLVIGGFYLFNAGLMSMGAIIASVMLAGRATAPIGQLALLMTRARQATATMRSLQKLTELPDERSLFAHSVVPAISRGDIELDHVSVAYPGGSGDALADISITIRAGERIGVIGRIASGKSTLGRLICGLYPPTGGGYLIDGLDSRQHHPHAVRDAFRFVSQDAELFTGSVRDNLAMGAATPDDERLIDSVRRSGADSFLGRDAAGFDLQVGERGSRLSGGQRSFLVLSRALVDPCRLLFLDEPTGAMDPETERRFIERLAATLQPAQTLLISTHRDALLALVDRLIVLDGGHILADGPREAVLAALNAAPRAAARA